MERHPQRRGGGGGWLPATDTIREGLERESAGSAPLVQHLDHSSWVGCARTGSVACAKIGVFRPVFLLLRLEIS